MSFDEWQRKENEVRKSKLCSLPVQYSSIPARKVRKKKRKEGGGGRRGRDAYIDSLKVWLLSVLIRGGGRGGGGKREGG